MIATNTGEGTSPVRCTRRIAATGLITTALVGSNFIVGGASASAVPSACEYGTVVCVSQGSRTIRLMKNGHTVIKTSARFGASRTPTRYGSFRVYWKDVDHVSSLFGSAMPFSMFFSNGQAIHYSSDFARNGYSGRSHGCVNTRNWSATRALFNSVGIGTRVYIY